MSGTFISIAKVETKIHSMLNSLEAQHNIARNKYKILYKKSVELRAEVDSAYHEYNMAKQRREALYDVLSVLEDMEKK